MDTLSALGYWGLFIGTFLSSTVIPFSADFLLVGILAAGGSPIKSLIIASVGNWLGGMTSYGIGYIGKWEWIEKWLRVKREKLEKQKNKIKKYGVLLAFLTWLPIIGDLFAVALGFYKIKPVQSAIYMFIGRFLRFLAWILLYQQFGEKFINWVTLKF